MTTYNEVHKSLTANAKHEKHENKNKTDKSWKTNWNNALFWMKRFYSYF